MPELSRFYGILIRMYFSDHPPPHFHAKYGGLPPISALNTTYQVPVVMRQTSPGGPNTREPQGRRGAAPSLASLVTLVPVEHHQATGASHTRPAPVLHRI
jgi:hypothetical protein